jgi:hypothetical protein
MRRLEELEEKVHGALAEGEVTVREDHVHRGWLVLTDRRLLLYRSSLTGHPTQVVLDEPLAGLTVAWRWVWSRLDRRIVISRDGRRLGVVRMRSRRSPGRLAQRIVKDVRHWATVARLTAGQDADVPLAHIHATALAAITPAQLARDIGVDPKDVRAVLEERVGVHVSTGAALRYSYTRRDRRVFDEAAKERLFAALVDVHGGDALIQRALAVGQEWWESGGADLFEDVLSLGDVELSHVSQRRPPLTRWQAWFLWIGFAVAAVTALAIIPPLIWRDSWSAWRAGDTPRPAGAIGLGVLGVLAVVAVPMVAQLV